MVHKFERIYDFKSRYNLHAIPEGLTVAYVKIKHLAKAGGVNSFQEDIKIGT